MEKPKRKELYNPLNKKPPVEDETMEVYEENQDYSEVVNDPEFLQSVLQNLPGVDLDSKAVTANMEAINEEEQAKKAAPGTTISLSYTGCLKKSIQRAKAAEKAAKREATKKGESSVDEEQAKEAALKKEAIYENMIKAWKRSVQVRADAEEAHEKPIDVEVTERAADKKAALGKEITKEAI